MEMVQETLEQLRRLWANKRQLLTQGLSLLMIIFTALMIWNTLMFFTKSESPVVVVLSGSMEPAFQRGDILFLTNGDSPLRVGEIVVYKVKNREIPIVHRILEVHEAEDGEVEVLTKGDNNAWDDLSLYAPGQRWLKRSDIVGRAGASVPYVGMATIILNDYPMLKYVLIALMGVLVVTTNE